MSGSDFEVKGLDDLSEKLLSAIEEFPGTAEKGLVTYDAQEKEETAEIMKVLHQRYQGKET